MAKAKIKQIFWDVVTFPGGLVLGKTDATQVSTAYPHGIIHVDYTPSGFLFLQRQRENAGEGVKIGVLVMLGSKMCLLSFNTTYKMSMFKQLDCLDAITELKNREALQKSCEDYVRKVEKQREASDSVKKRLKARKG